MVYTISGHLVKMGDKPRLKVKKAVKEKQSTVSEQQGMLYFCHILRFTNAAFTMFPVIKCVMVNDILDILQWTKYGGRFSSDV